MRTSPSPRGARRAWLAKLSIDLLLWSLAAPISLLLRQEGNVRHADLGGLALYLGVGLAIKVIVLIATGLERRSWVKSSTQDLTALIVAVGIGSLLEFAFGWILHGTVGFPRTLPIIAGALAILMMGGVRLALRMITEERARGSAEGASRVLLVGAGDAGARFAREMRRDPKTGLRPVGFLDDDPGKQGTKIGGIPVLGTLESLQSVARSAKADEVVIAIPSASGATTRAIFDLAEQAGIRCRIIPSLAQLLTGRVGITSVREIEVDDLLHREPVELDREEMEAFLNGRVVLVTGAGGSIGSELVRQSAKFGPQRLILLGAGENSLHAIERELTSSHRQLAFSTVVGSVRDGRKMDEVMRRFRPDVVFHAAAHKHVPMMQYNVDEAILNNVGGTLVAAKAARRHGVAHFVNVSSDKAVNPGSVMGFTKYLAEQVVRAIAAESGTDCTFVSVRFGNVLGSRGSVVPVFQEQIARGGPVTVTDPDMSRFFMTIPEATQLVIQAGTGHETGVVYVLDMGEPVKIIDLARDVIRLAGKEDEIQVVITGARPGEKMHEELLSADEVRVETPHPMIMAARSTTPLSADLLERVAILLDAARDRDWDAIDTQMAIFAPGLRGAGLGASGHSTGYGIPETRDLSP